MKLGFTAAEERFRAECADWLQAQMAAVAERPSTTARRPERGTPAASARRASANAVQGTTRPSVSFHDLARNRRP